MELSIESNVSADRLRSFDLDWTIADYLKVHSLFQSDDIEKVNRCIDEMSRKLNLHFFIMVMIFEGLSCRGYSLDGIMENLKKFENLRFVKILFSERELEE